MFVFNLNAVLHPIWFKKNLICSFIRSSLVPLCFSHCPLNPFEKSFFLCALGAEMIKTKIKQ